MKTKVKMFSAIAVFAIAFGVNASISMTKKSPNVILSELVNASDANAECPQYPMNNGRCSELTGNCYWNPDYTQCDTNGSWGGNW